MPAPAPIWLSANRRRCAVPKASGASSKPSDDPNRRLAGVAEDRPSLCPAGVVEDGPSLCPAGVAEDDPSRRPAGVAEDACRPGAAVGDACRPGVAAPIALRTRCSPMRSPTKLRRRKSRTRRDGLNVP